MLREIVNVVAWFLVLAGLMVGMGWALATENDGYPGEHGVHQNSITDIWH